MRPGPFNSLIKPKTKTTHKGGSCFWWRRGSTAHLDGKGKMDWLGEMGVVAGGRLIFNQKGLIVGMGWLTLKSVCLFLFFDDPDDLLLVVSKVDGFPDCSIG